MFAKRDGGPVDGRTPASRDQLRRLKPRRYAADARRDGYSRGLMVRSWDAHDERALKQLVARGALYSATRDLKNAAASYGEYLVSCTLGATRFGQAHPGGDCDCLLPSGP